MIPDTYEHREGCDNCSKMQTFDIPKGVTICDFMRGVKCSNCGCSMIRSSYNYMCPTNQIVQPLTPYKLKGVKKGDIYGDWSDRRIVGGVMSYPKRGLWSQVK